ncbi:hypothetical protein [Candidatus Amarolinea dominans]|uniref:hypothetical protein n=1 Tax=Candidatus Amarolinea dominans TaxID=3140696 RepID=UPI001D1EF04C|nr:hypothetical protein [Anaerolineae bacterium]
MPMSGIGPRLVILNLSNPANPVAGQSAVLPDIISAVQVMVNSPWLMWRTITMAACRSSRQQQPPVIVGSYNTPKRPMAWPWFGTTVYVADGSVAQGAAHHRGETIPAQPILRSSISP